MAYLLILGSAVVGVLDSRLLARSLAFAPCLGSDSSATDEPGRSRAGPFISPHPWLGSRIRYVLPTT